MDKTFKLQKWAKKDIRQSLQKTHRVPFLKHSILKSFFNHFGMKNYYLDKIFELQKWTIRYTSMKDREWKIEVFNI